jgi:tetratricopeptide (TPR) repeat protein
VIDNLDDINVADGLLPENGSQKHTIITTRNPNADGIPAEPLEVPLLGPNGSIELLSTLSKITVQPDSPEEHQAAEIVRKLGYLPLAIEQAAAYVREVTADFSTFLKEYEQNHKKLYMWVPAGNRQYPNSIATTWSMSFNLLQKYPAKLLRLFSFLNPDSILIPFLVSGAEALQQDLRHIIFDHVEMATALLELEKFSLIKWDRPNKSITIHRLVQVVVIDQMSAEESLSTFTNVIDLFTQAFPKLITNKTRLLCRTYQGQMVEPLLRMKTMRTSESALIRRRVGEFLYDDGKYDDSEKLLLQAVETYASVLGTEKSETLSAMHALALTYQAQGRNAEAAAIQEQVLEKGRRILGEEHPDTLSAMHALALTYQAQGRNADAAANQ